MRKVSKGFNIELAFRPTEEVWYLDNHGIKKAKVIKVLTETRSLISTEAHIESRISYMIEDGTILTDKQVFDSKEQLIKSL